MVNEDSQLEKNHVRRKPVLFVSDTFTAKGGANITKVQRA